MRLKTKLVKNLIFWKKTQKKLKNRLGSLQMSSNLSIIV